MAQRRILRTREFWDAVVTQLSTSDMAGILGGSGRIYAPYQRSSIPEREEARDVAWGRIVMLPRETLWPQMDTGEWRNMAWLMSVQFNDFRHESYDVGVATQAAHDEIKRRLEGFRPTGLSKINITMPVWRFGYPYQEPVFDQQRQLWLNNAEYRCQMQEAVVVV